VASWFDDPDLLAEEARLHNELYGMRLEFWPREQLREAYRSPRYHDGLFDPDGFHLDPLRLCDGYAAAAETHSARIFENTPATALERRGDRFLVRTPQGQVRAERVVLCQSVYPPGLRPELTRAGLAIATFIIVTEPLGSRAADAIRAPYAVYDDRFATGYYRLLADGRLLWGGRVALTERPSRLVPLMRRDLLTVFPQLGHVRIDHAWSGRMGFTRHKMPLIRELEPGLWTATLFGGHGLNTTTMAGELVARAIVECHDAWRLFEPFRPTRTYGPLGRFAAQALFHGHALKDSLRAGWLRKRGKRMPGAKHSASQDQGG
jgi:gamma-glutamylputrescine oxidase